MKPPASQKSGTWPVRPLDKLWPHTLHFFAGQYGKNDKGDEYPGDHLQRVGGWCKPTGLSLGKKAPECGKNDAGDRI